MLRALHWLLQLALGYIVTAIVVILLSSSIERLVDLYPAHKNDVLIGSLVIAVYLFESMGRAFFRLVPLSILALAWSDVKAKQTRFALLLDFLATFSGLVLADPAFYAFWFLILFKFIKVFVHFVSYNLYKPIPIPANPTYTPNDVTVIIPTVGDLDREFVECVRSILATGPRQILISTVGTEKLARAKQVCNLISSDRIRCISVSHPNKRNQVTAGINQVRTPITVLADDHVFWPLSFLQAAIAPFENPKVSHVGTVKRVRRERQGFCFNDFLNYIACIYLERHNYECTASSFIDGGVFVISGRTALLRTSVIQDPAFQAAFLNETWLFGPWRVGPLNVDDDNFITRWMVTHGYSIVFQNSPLALMQTTLGTAGGWTKFRGQLDRWARTTVRSNLTTLFYDRTVWYAQPWCVYAVYISALVNYALFYDAALYSLLYVRFRDDNRLALWMKILTAALLFTKIMKPFPHLLRNPRDLVYLPLGILFGYYHSFVKLNSVLTARNVAWGTRAGVK